MAPPRRRRRARRVALPAAAAIAAGTAAVLGAAGSAATAAGDPAPRGRLVYSMYREGPPQCYTPPCTGSDDLEPGEQSDWLETVRADGSDRRRITPIRTGSGDGFCPGGQPRFLGQPRISPNGRLIARGHCHKVLLVGLDGHRVETLHVPGNATSMDWGPDGRRLAVQTYDSPGDTNRLYIVDRRDDTHRSIARSAGSDVRWSPRENLIAYTEIPTGHVIFARPSGRVVHRIKREIDGFDFSPTDRRIAYPCEEGVCVVRVDGTHRHVLTRRCGHDAFSSVAWAPDGRWIACARPRAVVVVDLRTDAVRRVRRLRRDDTFEYASDLDWGPAPEDG